MDGLFPVHSEGPSTPLKQSWTPSQDSPASELRWTGVWNEDGKDRHPQRSFHRKHSQRAQKAVSRPSRELPGASAPILHPSPSSSPAGNHRGTRRCAPSSVLIQNPRGCAPGMRSQVRSYPTPPGDALPAPYRSEPPGDALLCPVLARTPRGCSPQLDPCPNPPGMLSSLHTELNPPGMLSPARSLPEPPGDAPPSSIPA